MSVKSQLAYSSASEAERSQQGPSRLGLAVTLHRSSTASWKTSGPVTGLGGFNERPMPGMYEQVYLVKLSDLFF